MFIQTALFYAIAFLILALNLFQWRRTWKVYDGINRNLMAIMWHVWRVNYKSWIIFCLFIANILMIIAIIVVYHLGIKFPKELLFYGLLVTLSTTSWNLLPPTVLFLANSREESGRIAEEIQSFLRIKGLRITYLLRPTSAPTALGYMDNFRTKDNLQWERAVHEFMRVVPIIAIDVRIPSAGVSRETDLIFDHRLAHKTLFMVKPDGSSEILERMFPSALDRSFLLRCNHEYVLEPLRMLIENIFAKRKPLEWER